VTLETVVRICDFQSSFASNTYPLLDLLHWNLCFCSVATLQNACRDSILQHVPKDKISQLPVPTKIKEYLQYEAS